ncbi:MAG: hypothetical protein SGJ24_00440 [Chloroflexota bacterium]|nr:hypothetical protein [Chloroflexota bacterium]
MLKRIALLIAVIILSSVALLPAAAHDGASPIEADEQESTAAEYRGAA